MRSLTLLAALTPLVLPLSPSQEERAAPAAEDAARDALRAALAEAGVLIDFEAGAAAIDVGVLVKDDLLEYLLIGPLGATHESLFQTNVTPSFLNTALLALGAEPGTNATWETIDPPPTLEERRAGKKPYTVTPPFGDGFYLYVTWREGDEVFRYRLEDLVANLKTGRAMARHRFVFLGSTFLPPEAEGDAPVFAADVEGNLINVSFFRAGHTLLTAALPDCEDQSIWLANPYLLPRRGATVRLVFAREPRRAEPAAWDATLPRVKPLAESHGEGAHQDG